MPPEFVVLGLWASHLGVEASSKFIMFKRGNHIGC